MVNPQLNQQFSDTPIWKFPKWVVPLNHQLYCVVVIIKCLRVNQPQHKKHVWAILKWAGPPWWIKGGNHPIHQSHWFFFVFVTCFEHHSFQASHSFDSDKPLTQIPPSGSDYNHTYFVALAPGLFVTLQSQACDFAVTSSVCSLGSIHFLG